MGNFAYVWCQENINMHDCATSKKQLKDFYHSIKTLTSDLFALGFAISIKSYFKVMMPSIHYLSKTHHFVTFQISTRWFWCWAPWNSIRWKLEKYEAINTILHPPKLTCLCVLPIWITRACMNLLYYVHTSGYPWPLDTVKSPSFFKPRETHTKAQSS